MREELDVIGVHIEHVHVIHAREESPTATPTIFRILPRLQMGLLGTFATDIKSASIGFRANHQGGRLTIVFLTLELLIAIVTDRVVLHLNRLLLR